MKGDADMLKKLVLIMTLLLVCITMMIAALLIDEAVFMQVSGYFALACVVVSLVGVSFLMINEKKNKGDKK